MQQRTVHRYSICAIMIFCSGAVDEAAPAGGASFGIDQSQLYFVAPNLQKYISFTV